MNFFTRKSGRVNFLTDIKSDHLENKVPGKAEAFSHLQLKKLNEVCAFVTSLYEALNSASLASTSMQYNFNFFYSTIENRLFAHYAYPHL